MWILLSFKGLRFVGGFGLLFGPLEGFGFVGGRFGGCLRILGGFDFLGGFGLFGGLEDLGLLWAFGLRDSSLVQPC